MTTSIRLVKLESKTVRVSLGRFIDKRSKDQKKADTLQTRDMIDSNITPFLTTFEVNRKILKKVYIYLAFDEPYYSDDCQLCIEKISGEKTPYIKYISADSQSIIISVSSDKVNLDAFKYNNQYVSHFKAIKTPPQIISPENYAAEFRRITMMEHVDDFTIKNVVAVFEGFSQSVHDTLVKSKLFAKFRICQELNVMFGELNDSKNIDALRNYEFISCAYLIDFDFLPPNAYDTTFGKTKIKLPIVADAKKLKGKPAVCIVDCGISKILNVSDESKLDFVEYNELDHGTQVASLSVCASDLLSGKKTISQDYNLYSYVICDGEKENIVEGLVNAIKTYRTVCKLFVMSYNFYDKLPSDLFQYLSRRLDHFIQKSNVTVLLSTGNITDSSDNANVSQTYLNKNSILFPSNCKNVIATGSLIEYNSPTRQIAPDTRFQPCFADLNHRGEEFFILKPNIYVFGGGKINAKTARTIKSVAYDGSLVNYYGSSFANGLLGYYYLRLMELCPQFNHSETYRALMLSCGQLDHLINKEESSKKITLNSIEELNYGVKSVLLCNEHQYALNDYRRDQTSQNSEQVQFYIDAEKIEKIQVYLVHSNDFLHNPLTRSIIYFNVRMLEPNNSKRNNKFSFFGDKSEWSTFGKCTPVQIAEYITGKTQNVQRRQTGMWKLQVLPIRKYVPMDADAKIRWGVVIKVTPRVEFIDELDEIYQEITEKSLGLTKPIVDVTKSDAKKSQEA